ncbi:PilW family protein [Thiocapsa rosea]|uniref:Type IV pilus assembly protein PilW n=1 Tax=Thiocapsa rosea TaxID=69360 RepID=A0A495VDA9_9GAMM|nr:PilW family protein [Thiocapsa rosea]RKT46770.1 type IV pilus assembly protein PilW [Thiocapsa rosea]
MSATPSRRDEIKRRIGVPDHPGLKPAGMPIRARRSSRSHDGEYRRRGTGSPGFTLIELMIAMTIGVFLLGTLALVLSNNSRTRYEIEKSIGQIQNARHAMQMITDDISNAGFYGEALIPAGAALPSLCPTAANLDAARAYPVQGADNIAGLPQACADIGVVLTGNDLVAVRRTSTCAVGDLDCDAFVDGLPHLQQPACSADCLDPPHCSPWIRTTQAALTARVRSCTAGAYAPIYRLYSRLYYLAPSNRPNDGIPTLKRADLTANGYAVTPIAEGIEHLHFEYGIDRDDNGEPDEYLDGIVDAGDWQDVVAVRVHLLARNASPTHGHLDDRIYHLGDEVIEAPGDAYKRQAYSTTVRLNNIAGRREDVR